MSTPSNPFIAGLVSQNPDSYTRWKEERRLLHLQASGNNQHLADKELAFEIIDTEYFVRMGTAKTAMDRYKDRGPAKSRNDISQFKNFVHAHRASLAMLGMSDIVRYHIEKICNAAEELAETEE